MRLHTAFGLLPLVAFPVPAFAAPGDIVETAVEAGQFHTLAAALGAADLVEALQGGSASAQLTTAAR